MKRRSCGRTAVTWKRSKNDREKFDWILRLLSSLFQAHQVDPADEVPCLSLVTAFAESRDNQSDTQIDSSAPSLSSSHQAHPELVPIFGLCFTWLAPSWCIHPTSRSLGPDVHSPFPHRLALSCCCFLFTSSPLELDVPSSFPHRLNLS